MFEDKDPFVDKTIIKNYQVKYRSPNICTNNDEILVD
jgi:hypothetical protein